jgi:hypothetical protein
MPDPFVAQLGRISGPLLTDNLVRDGINLSFRNEALDPDLLFLEVTDMRVGINTDSPAYALDINADVHTIDAIVTNRATFDNVIFQAASTVTSVTGPINIVPTGPDPVAIFDRLGTADLSLNPLIYFDGNTIQSYNNTNIAFNPNGTGTIELQTNTIIVGNDPAEPALRVVGNIELDGDLSTNSNIIIGDNPMDVVIIQTDLTQDINPGTDLAFNLGSVSTRWSQVYIEDWRHIDTIRPNSAFVGSGMFLGGPSNQLRALTLNDDFLILPDTGITRIEQLEFDQSIITNLNSTTPITLLSTGIGYVRFAGDNAVVIPSGTIAERPITPEVGDTRWNTELGYLECFDGTVYVLSTGGGDEVTQSIMEDLGNVYTLMLG